MIQTLLKNRQQPDLPPVSVEFPITGYEEVYAELEAIGLGHIAIRDCYVAEISGDYPSTGKVTGVKAGKVTITATAGDGSGVSGNVDITVTEAGTAPKISTTPLPDGTVGTAYSQDLTADGDAPVIWQLASGSLPDGLTLGQNGAISGTPTKNGNFSFTVQATNDYGSDTKQLSIQIDPTESGNTCGISLSQTGQYTFPTQAAGYNPLLPLDVTVSNMGNQPTGALSVTLSGAGKDSYGVYPFSINSINAGGSAKFFLTPNLPLHKGTYTATVTLSGVSVTPESFEVSFTVNDGSGSDYTIGLSQTGQQPYTFAFRSLPGTADLPR